MASSGGRPRGRGRLSARLLLAGAAVGCARLALGGVLAAFAGVAPAAAGEGPSRAEAVVRRAKGFSDVKVRRKRKKVDVDQLVADHGAEKAKDVEMILRGKPAACPEDMLRARFSAIKARDATFMARTERDETRQGVDERARGWAVTFGMEERVKELDGEELSKEQKELLTAKSIEVKDATGKERSSSR
ncbi:unnamed protein product [Prorocentrum cordatum]|uniref:Uncharacterized protein n=1 Tax=Prorocentrum cordatum TaxID=2364126 RepID=A0ABN9R7A3_9DINO|nr:unnamed protein product [Polarella glacialis]